MKYKTLKERIKDCPGSNIIDRNYMKRKNVCWMTTNDRVLIELTPEIEQCKYMSDVFYTDAKRRTYYECKK